MDILDGNLMTVVSVAGAALLFLLRLIFKDRAGQAETNFQLGVNIAYQIVNEVATRTENKIDDKVAVALGYLRDFLSTKGQSLTPADEQRAKLLFQAMHGQEIYPGPKAR